MRPRGNDRFVLAAFALLAMSSLGLKAIAGPPRDGRMNVSAERFDQQLASSLQAQHFAVTKRNLAHRSALILAVRGACRVGARDARQGAAMETLFARDAAGLGPVRYLYYGRSYDHPPAFAMRIGRLQTEALSRLGMSPRAPMPVAIAATPACGTSDFGLADVRI
jgi:hypothetical protein